MLIITSLWTSTDGFGLPHLLRWLSFHTCQGAKEGLRNYNHDGHGNNDHDADDIDDDDDGNDDDDHEDGDDEFNMMMK